MKGLEPGQQVDQFRIVRKLGQGGMSEVYLARDTTLGRKVALKIIRNELAVTPSRLKFFLREAHLTARFAHPHIITIHFVGEFKGHPYLALEYLEGQTLEERMRKRAMSAPETIRLGLAIAQALEEAHFHGVLHRDLKPANVIIPQDGRLRVLDFGISKLVEESTDRKASERDSFYTSEKNDSLSDGSWGRTNPHAKEKHLHEKVTITASEIRGTPAYMAPERWIGEKVTSAADVWALGAMLYEMLTEVHPYHSTERNVISLAKKIVFTHEPPSLPQNVDVPEELSQLIASMLDTTTSRRPSAKGVVHVLRSLLQRSRGQPLEKVSPFRGLLPFSERHADLFFGRNAEIEMALERLHHEPILPIVGPSGAGKSSFIAAGIVPRLREMDHWLVLKVRPGKEPFEALVSVLQTGWRDGEGNTLSPWSSIVPNSPIQKGDLYAAETVGETQQPSSGSDKLGGANVELSELKTVTVLPQKGDIKGEAHSSNDEQCRRFASEGLSQKLLEQPARLLLELQELAQKTQGKVLLFVDQLEELYTHSHNPELRLAYMEAISRAADDPEGPIRVIFSVREDFLGRVAESPSARETLSRIMVLRAPDKQALHKTVVKPVELAGYNYEDEDLPEEMIEVVREAPSSLPILQFACSQLWNRRNTEKRLLTRSAYKAMGGVEGALASKADELLAGLTEGQRKVARQLMLRLVTPEGTRRVVTEKELFDGLSSNAGFVLNNLTAARMVVSRRSAGEDSAEAELELVHDSLIKSWKPLVRWLEQSREEVVFLDEVSRAADLWDSRGRPQEEVWSDDALEEALLKVRHCEVVPKRVTDFLEAGELKRQVRLRGHRKVRIAVFSMLLSVIAVLALMISITVDQRKLAEIERDLQQAAHAQALREGARAAYTRGDFLESRSKLRGSLETRDSTQSRALWWLLEKEPLVWSQTLESAGNRVSASPDGLMIAASSNYINIYDTKTLERSVLNSHKMQVEGLQFSPNSRWLASGSDDREIHLRDMREGTVKVLKGHEGVVWSTAFSPDGKRIVSGSDDTTIKIWDTESGTLIRTIKSKSRVWRVFFSSDGRFIISANLDDKVRFWNAQTYELELVVEEPGMYINNAHISADGKLLAYSISGGVIVVRDLEKLQEIVRLSNNLNDIFSLSMSSNGDFLAASTADGRVLIWNTKNWSIHRQFHQVQGAVSDVSFLPNGKQVVTSSDEGTLKLWNLDVDSFQKESPGHSFRIYGLAFAPDGETIATGSDVDGEIRLWDVKSGQSIRHIQGHDTHIFAIAFNHTGKLLAAGTSEGSIRLYLMPHGKLLKTLHGHSKTVSRVLFSPDDTQLISSSWDKTIAYWNLESLKLEKTIATETTVNHFDIHPDGRLMASGEYKLVKLRDFESGQVLRTFSGHTNFIWSVTFSPDGKSLYTSSWDNTVRRYQLGSSLIHGEVVASHQGHIYGIDLTNSTHHILGTSSADKTAKLWNLDNGHVIMLKGHLGEVNQLQFSPDGTRAATVSDDSTLRLWDTKTGRPLWRAPLMLEEPPLLFTQKGWVNLEHDIMPQPSMKQWQKAVELRGKFASATADLQSLCVATFGDKLEIWDIPSDECILKKQHSNIHKILAIRSGCLTLSDGALTLIKTSGESVILGKRVEAMNRFDSSVVVLQNGNVRVLDLDGELREEFTATTGASALTIVGDSIVFGFPERRLEVWKRDGSSSQRDFACREVESSTVTTVIPGPPDTIIVGFANGTVGIWSIDTGERLFSYRLHGPVIHLLLQNQSLYAATELGSRVRFDLSMFYIDYCDLMERIWREVFWIWEGGRARYRDVPSDHECSQRR